MEGLTKVIWSCPYGVARNRACEVGLNPMGTDSSTIYREFVLFGTCKINLQVNEN